MTGHATPRRKVCGCCGRVVAPGTHGLLGPDGRRTGRAPGKPPEPDGLDWRGVIHDLAWSAGAALVLAGLFVLVVMNRP